MTEFIARQDDEPEPTFDFSEEETLFVQLDDGQIIHVTVVSDTSGWCSCDLYYDGPLDYMIEQSCGDEFTDPFGAYIIEGCTGAYIKGDGCTTDDDADFYPGTVRPASEEEIRANG